MKGKSRKMKARKSPTKNKRNKEEKMDVEEHSEHEEESHQDDNSDDVQEEQDEQNERDEHSESDADKSKETKGTRERREKTKFDYERNSRTIFVGNLPVSFDKRKVTQLFKSCGPVESARIRSIVPEKEKVSPKVALITKKLHPKVNSFNAYVVFKTNEDDQCVRAALKMNGKSIENHHIRVDRASRPKAKKETLASRKKSVFVGNLRFDLREDDLINFFSKVGPVNYVRLVRDSSTGLGKGFGFVVFDERASVKKALELNETKYKGRSLRVKKVDEKTPLSNKKN